MTRCALPKINLANVLRDCIQGKTLKSHLTYLPFPIFKVGSIFG